MASRKLDAETSEGAGDLVLRETEHLPSRELDPELWSSLPEDLQEEIVARLPRKTLVQSQLLCKKWESHFCSLLFQAEVSSVCSKWPSYAPVFINKTLGIIRGYDRSTQKWETLFSIPSLLFGEHVCRAESTFWKCAGSLLVLFHWGIGNLLHIVVTNPITRSVRNLPALGFKGEAFLDPQFGWVNSVECYPVNHYDYRVIVASTLETMRVNTSFLLVRVYDSTSNSWGEPRSGPQLRFCWAVRRSFAHLDGVFYVAEVPVNLVDIIDHGDGDFTIGVVPRYPNAFVLYVWDLETGNFEEVFLTLPPEELPKGLVRIVRLVVCQDELMVVVGPPAKPKYPPNDRLREDMKSFIVFRFDPNSSDRELEEICRAEPSPLRDTWFGGTLFSDKECIYMNVAVGDLDARHHVLVFNVRERVWSFLRPCEEEPEFLHGYKLIQSVFEPGLNPFVLA